MPIVRVHMKALETHERSRSKLFRAPSYPTPVFVYPTIPPLDLWQGAVPPRDPIGFCCSTLVHKIPSAFTYSMYAVTV